MEATKFTEVGYVGRDVESIIRDLLEQTITEVHNGRIAEVEERARAARRRRASSTRWSRRRSRRSAPKAGGAGDARAPRPSRTTVAGQRRCA